MAEFVPSPGYPAIPYEQWKVIVKDFLLRKEILLSRLLPRTHQNAGNAEAAEEEAETGYQRPPVYSDSEKKLDLIPKVRPKCHNL